LNKVTLIGRVGRDPEMKLAPNGTHWTSLSVATNRNRKDGDKWVEETDWHQVRCFGADAEYVGKHVRRGSLISVEGEIHYARWTTSDGEPRWAARINADRVGLLSAARDWKEDTAS
jgi:single-strand DNA-binding protein